MSAIQEFFEFSPDLGVVDDHFVEERADAQELDFLLLPPMHAGGDEEEQVSLRAQVAQH